MLTNQHMSIVKMSYDMGHGTYVLMYVFYLGGQNTPGLVVN